MIGKLIVEIDATKCQDVLTVVGKASETLDPTVCFIYTLLALISLKLHATGVSLQAFYKCVQKTQAHITLMILLFSQMTHLH